MSAAPREVLIGRLRVTVYPDRGPRSARRSYDVELGGYISRRHADVRPAHGLDPEDYGDIVTGSRYRHNADVYARTHRLSRLEALRSTDFNDAAIRAYAARQRRDADALFDALDDMGYRLTADDREKYRAAIEGRK